MKCIQLSECNLNKINKNEIDWINLGTSHVIKFTDVNNLKEFSHSSDIQKNKKKAHYIIPINDDYLFWNKAVTYPLLIIRFVKGFDLESLKRINDSINETENFQIYRSLDDYQYVIFHCTDSYARGMSKVHKILYESDSIFSTYTMIAIRNNESVLKEHLDKTIEKARIKIKFNEKLENDLKKFFDLFNKDNNKLLLRTGNNDGEVTYHDLNLYSLLKTVILPLLDESSEYYCGKYIINFDVQLPLLPENNEEIAYRKGLLLDKSKNDEINYDKGIVDEDFHLIKTFILDTEKRRDLSVIFLCLIDAYNLFVQKYKQSKACMLDQYESSMDFYKNATHLINLHKLSIMQKRDFLWEEIGRIPARLLGIYKSTTDIFKSILQETNEEEYVFLIVPSKIESINVSVLFKSDNIIKNRLLLVKIPSNKMLNIKLIFFSLAHEVAHYVPQDLRKRKDRANYLWRIALISFTNILFSNRYIDKIDDCMSVLSRCKDELKRQFGGGDSIYLRNNIRKIILETFLESRKDISYEIFYDRENIDFGEIQQFYETYSMAYNVLETTFDDYMYYLDECFSDIVAILLLDVDFLVYFNILNGVQYDYIKTKESKVVDYRIAFVYITLVGLGKIERTIYNQFSINIKNIIDQVELFEKSNFKDRGYYKLMIHPAIILNIITYLTVSAESLEARIKEKEQDERLLLIRNIFNNLNCTNSDQFNSYMLEALSIYDQYEQDYIHNNYILRKKQSN